jgi:hypothetical protein
MQGIHLKGGLSVDNEDLKEFEKKIMQMLAAFKTHAVLAKMMGKEKGNWSNYMSGDKTITLEFMEEFEDIFRHPLNKLGYPIREKTANTREPKTPFPAIETKLDNLVASTKQIADGQDRLEKKIDDFLKERP